MVYQTILKSLESPRGAKGERLQFIGNFPCKIGDPVWTDGRVIFGDRPIRFTPPVPEIGGEVVPVICGGTQGYFDLKGKFHEKNLPVSSYFVNDANNFYSVPANAYDAEIYLDADGKSAGVRYVTYSQSTLRIFKDGSLENRFNADEIFPYDSVFFYGAFLTQNGDWFAVINGCTESSTSSGWTIPRSYYSPPTVYETGGYSERGIEYSSTHTERATFLLHNGGTEQTLLTFVSDYTVFRDYGRTEATYGYEPAGGYYIFYHDVIVRPARSYSTSSQSYSPAAGTLTLPLQDDFQVQFFQTREENQPFYVEQFKIFDKDDQNIFTADFPLSDRTTIRNIPVVKLKGNKFLFGHNNSLYLFSDGEIVKKGDGLRNFRLRKMKLNKIGKSSF